MTAIELRAPRWMRSLATLGAVSGLLMGVAQAEAQAGKAVGGKAYGSYVNTSLVTDQSPVATLPVTGGYAVGETETWGVPNTVDSKWLTAVTTGAVDNNVSTAQSTSELENVSVLNGLISADNVTAIASSYVNGTGAASDAAGSGFVNLVVNGTPITTDLSPNTQIPLPGVGYVVLNEQARIGDGVATSGITVNMIHVVLQDALTGAKTGEIIVGAASSSVN